MHTWWDALANERFWLEITDRPDLGIDLKAPQLGDNGAEYWSYSLVNEVKEGDIVFHYHKPATAIVAWSRAVGLPWEEEIVWASHGSVAREAGVIPYRRPGWRIGLEDFTQLPVPLELDELREAETGLRAIASEVEARHGKPTYFPFAISDRRPPRPAQGYLTKLPEALVSYFPQLADAALLAERTAESAGTNPPARGPLGVDYRPAEEDASTSERDAFSVDPAIVERGLRGHAMTQNAVALWVRARGFHPRSPRPDEPNFDLAWTEGDRIYVAEVKSTTASNEEKQLRLGLGQVLRYRQLLCRPGATATAVLAIENEPKDSSWVELCADLGVQLVWPDALQ